MTGALSVAGDEPAATDLDSIITHALAERGDGDAADAAGVESVIGVLAGFNWDAMVFG